MKQDRGARAYLRYGDDMVVLGDDTGSRVNCGKAVDARLQSWLGHARHADSYGLRKAIFGCTVFARGNGP